MMTAVRKSNGGKMRMASERGDHVVHCLYPSFHRQPAVCCQQCEDPKGCVSLASNTRVWSIPVKNTLLRPKLWG